MKTSSCLSLLLLFLCFATIYSQKITDGATVDVGGLAVTFNILNKESVSAGGKNYDRYKVSASVTNNSGKNISM